MNEKFDMTLTQSVTSHCIIIIDFKYTQIQFNIQNYIPVNTERNKSMYSDIAYVVQKCIENKWQENLRLKG